MNAVISNAIRTANNQTLAQVKQNVTDFKDIWHNFVLVAIALRKKGGKVVLEWPRRCKYWKRREVKKFLLEFDLAKATFDACMFGLTSPKGEPLRYN